MLHVCYRRWSSGAMIILIHEGAFFLPSETGSSDVGCKGLQGIGNGLRE